MADRQRNGDESFFEGNLGGLEEREARSLHGGNTQPVAAGQSVETRRGQQDGDAGDAPGSVSTLGLRIFIMMG